MKKGGSVLAVILLIVVALVAYFNRNSSVPLNLGFLQLTWPLMLIIALFTLLGILIASLIAIARGTKKREKIHHQDSRLKAADKERKAAVEDTKKTYEAQIIQKNAEIDGLKQRISSMEAQLTERLSSEDNSNKQEEEDHSLLKRRSRSKK